MKILGDLNWNSFGGVLGMKTGLQIFGLEEIKTANVDNSFKKFSSKRKVRNGAGAGWGSRIQSEFFGF